MKISVELYASLKQKSGWRQRSLQIPKESTIEELLAWMDRKYPELRIRQIPLYVAVNEEFAESGSKLQEDDRVAFFPPVSGGES